MFFSFRTFFSFLSWSCLEYKSSIQSCLGLVLLYFVLSLLVVNGTEKNVVSVSSWRQGSLVFVLCYTVNWVLRFLGLGLI